MDIKEKEKEVRDLTEVETLYNDLLVRFDDLSIRCGANKLDGRTFGDDLSDFRRDLHRLTTIWAAQSREEKLKDSLLYAKLTYGNLKLS